MEIKLNVYNKAGDVVKECKAQTCDIMFGTIRKLMKLFKVDSLENTAQVLQIVVDAWDDVTGILAECFPDISDDEWDFVKVRELLPVVLVILRDTFAEILTIPKDPKVNGE
jgi:hypothetical protein